MATEIKKRIGPFTISTQIINNGGDAEFCPPFGFKIPQILGTPVYIKDRGNGTHVLSLHDSHDWDNITPVSQTSFLTDHPNFTHPRSTLEAKVPTLCGLVQLIIRREPNS